MKQSIVKQVLKDLIRIDSQVTGSNGEIIDYIEKKLSKFELRKYLFKSKDGKFDLYNLIVKIPGEKSDSPLVFVGHTDTVPASPKWEKNPFGAEEVDGKIYGLGSSDMKGGLACMISAALSIDKTPPQDIYLIFDSDEEGNLMGAKNLLENFSLKNARIVVSEPTTRQIIYAQKGCLDMKVSFEGIGKHCARTDYEYQKNNNAIFKIVEFSKKLNEYFAKVETKISSELGRPVINIGKIEGGSAFNVVADSASLLLSYRLVDGQKVADELKKIESLAKEIDAGASIESFFEGEPFISDKNSEFIQLIKKIVPELQFGTKPTWTEAALFSKWGDVVICGPGIEEQCHRADEYTIVEDLELFEKIYLKLMLNSK